LLSLKELAGNENKGSHALSVCTAAKYPHGIANSQNH